MSILYTAIQRMCISDGPGIRTTVFLKGCSLRCPWCSNPENLEGRIQYYFREEKCIYSDGKCLLNKDCSAFGDRSEDNLRKTVCPAGAVGVYGTEAEAEELFEELSKDRVYWGTKGGVTFSGGEALLQINELEPLLKLLKNSGINIAFETALHVRNENVRTAIGYADFFYIDIKILEPEACKEILLGDVEQFEYNLELVVESGKRIAFRIPCSDEYTLNDRNIELLMGLISKYNDVPIELFRLHDLGNEKNRSLGIKIYKEPPSEKIDMLYERLKKEGYKASIITV